LHPLRAAKSPVLDALAFAVITRKFLSFSKMDIISPRLGSHAETIQVMAY
jgi:hypothetical protein